MKYEFPEDNWSVPINHKKLKDIGIYEHIKLLPIYEHMIIHANRKTHEMLFTFKYAADLFGIGFTKYNSILNELEKLGFIEIIERNTKNPTKILIKHYRTVVVFPRHKY